MPPGCRLMAKAGEVILSTGTASGGHFILHQSIAASCNPVNSRQPESSMFPSRCFSARILLHAREMMDIVFISGTCAFFVIAIAYVWGCTRL